MGFLARLLRLLCAGGIRLFLQELSQNEFSNDNERAGRVDLILKFAADARGDGMISQKRSEWQVRYNQQ